jgi:short subunit dehydrogenase-like uncharacterized protein
LSGAETGSHAAEDYPRQVYHPDGRTERVENAEQEQALGEGWSRTPSPVHQQPGGSARAAVHASGSDPLAMMFREVLEQVLDERGIGPTREERAKKREQEQAAATRPPPATTVSDKPQEGRTQRRDVHDKGER